MAMTSIIRQPWLYRLNHWKQPLKSTAINRAISILLIFHRHRRLTNWQPRCTTTCKTIASMQPQPSHKAMSMRYHSHSRLSQWQRRVWTMWVTRVFLVKIWMLLRKPLRRWTRGLRPRILVKMLTRYRTRQISWNLQIRHRHVMATNSDRAARIDCSSSRASRVCGVAASRAS